MSSAVASGQVRQRTLAGASSGPDAVKAAVTSPPFIAAIASLVLGIVVTVRKISTAAACSKCGLAFCSACKPGKNKDDYCLQCVHLFQRHDGVAPQLRANKMAEIASFERKGRLKSIVIGLLAPGCGQILRGQAFLGFALLLGFGFFVSGHLLRQSAFMGPGFVARAGDVTPPWMWLVGVVAVWLAANVANLVSKR